MKRTKKSKKGFTLIELIIVIAILAILALIAIPAYNQYRQNAKIEADNATAKVVYDAVLVADASSSTTDTWADYAKITGSATVTGTAADGDLKVVYGAGQFPLAAAPTPAA